MCASWVCHTNNFHPPATYAEPFNFIQAQLYVDSTVCIYNFCYNTKKLRAARAEVLANSPCSMNEWISSQINIVIFVSTVPSVSASTAVLESQLAGATCMCLQYIRTQMEICLHTLGSSEWFRIRYNFTSLHRFWTNLKTAIRQVTYDLVVGAMRSTISIGADVSCACNTMWVQILLAKGTR